MDRRLAIAALVLLLSACGPNGAPTDNSSPTSAASHPSGSGGVAPTVAGTDEGEHCGSERWPVKTLSDGDAKRVNFTLVDTTVSRLADLPKPATLPATTRISPTEVTTFRVTARVIEFKIEDDRDIHLVIADPNAPSRTMIAEFPDAEACAGADASAQASEMKAARAALIAEFGMPSATRFVRISGSVTLTGVGFFDVLHGQTGVAPNGVELHPVLSVTPARVP